MEIAAEIGVSGQTLYRLLRKDNCGVELKTASKLVAAFGFGVLKGSERMRYVSRSKVIAEKLLGYGKTTEAVAKMMGWSRQNLTKYTVRDKNIKTQTASKLREFFGVDAVDIIEE